MVWGIKKGLWDLEKQTSENMKVRREKKSLTESKQTKRHNKRKTLVQTAVLSGKASMHDCISDVICTYQF